MAAAKAVSKSRKNEKRRKSAVQEHVNGVKASQRSDEVRYGRPIGRGMQRGVHICQRSDEVRYGRLIRWGMQMGAHVFRGARK